MSKEKDLLKEILANTKSIMQHLKIAAPVATPKSSGKAETKKAPAKKQAAKKAK